MSERAKRPRTRVKAPRDGRSGAVKALCTIVQMGAAIGALVLLAAVLGVIAFCKACASGAGFLGGRKTPAVRYAVLRGRSWRRILYLFYLGSLASMHSSRASSETPDIAKSYPSESIDGGIAPEAAVFESLAPVHSRVAA